ncbi:acyl-CoA dehydrogenase family protein [Pseudarthrobacter sulfonivorans]|uniref:acyl-CoA dehydrogenase family protein n=1 Tax=Pseudarthrobacter sulfonivorans TaxID=121292 RepID=UPI00168BA0BC|nr:acyl-CoA dehydrogenase family protein [Pseudarthrobacter sulfonivorans]
MTTTIDETAGTTELAEFLRSAEKFLEMSTTRKGQRQTFAWGAGDDSVVAIWDESDREQQRKDLESAREWRRARFDAGFGWIDGPKDLGGRELESVYVRKYRALEATYDVPDQSFFKLDRVVAPVILRYAKPAFGENLARQLYRGDAVVCELFSEPGAGSDVFSVATQATEKGGQWLISGHKTWILDAHYADFGIVLARTDGGGYGPGGLSAFVIDMNAAGVEVRPLKLMTGGVAFNEVLLHEVLVGDARRLGDVNAGWPVAREILRRERAAIGGGFARSGSGIANGERLKALVKARGLSSDAVVRQELGGILINFWAAKQLVKRATACAIRKDDSGPAPLLGKISLSRNLHAVSEFVGDILGADITADTGEWGTFAWTSFLLGEPGVHLFAGSDEIVLNILAETVLGLPKEPKPAAQGQPSSSSQPLNRDSGHRPGRVT